MKNFAKLSVIAVVTILVIGSIIFNMRSLGVVKVSWKKPAQSAFFEAVDQIGEPSVLVTKDKGFAKWSADQMSKAGYPLYKLMIKDETIPHCCPTPHEDSVFGAIKVNAYDAVKMLAILGTSKGFWYDQGRNMLYARCCSLGTVLAHFVFATNVIKRDRDSVIQSYSQQTSNNLLVKEYTELFNQVYNPWNANDNKTYEEAREILRQQLATNLSGLSYTEVSSCNGQPECGNTLNFNSVNPLISGTPICALGPKAVALPGPPKSEVDSVENFSVCKTAEPGYDGHVFYYTGGVNPSGKQYTLGLRRTIDPVNPYS